MKAKEAILELLRIMNLMAGQDVTLNQVSFIKVEFMEIVFKELSHWNIYLSIRSYLYCSLNPLPETTEVLHNYEMSDPNDTEIAFRDPFLYTLCNLNC